VREPPVDDVASTLGRHCYPALTFLTWLSIGLFITSALSFFRPHKLTVRHTTAWRLTCGWCAGLAPTIGFLGTISGVRDGLGGLTGAASSDLEVLGEGLSYAFGTTLVGLIAAGVAVSAHTILNLIEGPEA